MQLHTLSKLVLVVSAVIGLAACASSKKGPTPLPLGDTSQATTASLLSNEFGFLADPSLTTQQLLNLRVYYFEFNKTELLGTNLLAVQAHGKRLSNDKTAKVLLKGYTDIQGSREYNIGLGFRRAKSVATTLMSEGATKAQIQEISYGSEFPADAGNTQEAYQKNRRVELLNCDGASCKSVYGQKALKGAVK
jgi:peptidoglycan-associated lipoprotein